MTTGTKVDATRAIKKIKKIQKDLDPDSILGLIGQRELNWINKNFRVGGLAKKWAPLSPNTIAARRGGGVGAQPLRDSGRLAQSFISKVDKPVVAVGTKEKIAKFHHEGTKPYRIRPKKSGGLLSFMTAKGPVLARSVRHPGLPKRELLPTKSVARRIAFTTASKLIEMSILEAEQGKL